MRLGGENGMYPLANLLGRYWMSKSVDKRQTSFVEISALRLADWRCAEIYRCRAAG